MLAQVEYLYAEPSRTAIRVGLGSGPAGTACCLAPPPRSGTFGIGVSFSASLEFWVLAGYSLCGSINPFHWNCPVDLSRALCNGPPSNLPLPTRSIPLMGCQTCRTNILRKPILNSNIRSRPPNHQKLPRRPTISLCGLVVRSWARSMDFPSLRVTTTAKEPSNRLFDALPIPIYTGTTRLGCIVLVPLPIYASTSTPVNM